MLSAFFVLPDLKVSASHPIATSRPSGKNVTVAFPSDTLTLKIYCDVFLYLSRLDVPYSDKTFIIRPTCRNSSLGENATCPLLPEG
jgi:hypothetical protein